MKWRQENRISQKMLAEEIHYSVSRISHIETGDLPLTQKIKDQIKKYDKQLHPSVKRSALDQKWQKIAYYSNIYGDEMRQIEAGLIDLLDIQVDGVGYDKTGNYLDFLGRALTELCKLKPTSSENNDDVKERCKSVANYIYKEGTVLLANK